MILARKFKVQIGTTTNTSQLKLVDRHSEMCRLNDVWLWFCVIDLVLIIQSVVRSMTTDAYCITNGKESLRHRRQIKFFNAGKSASLSDRTAISKSISSPSEPISRPKRKSKSTTTQQKDINKSTITKITAPISAHDADATTSLPKVKARNVDPNNNTKTRIDLSIESMMLPPTHWIDDSDKVIYEEISIPLQEATNTTSSSTVTTQQSHDETMAMNSISTTTVTIPSVFHCTIRGNPLPLRRHRTRRGFIYNPSAATQLTFRNLVLKMIDSLPSHQNSTSTAPTLSIHNDNVPRVAIPLWNMEQPIAVSIVFRMKRPNSHFIANKPFVETTSKSKKNATSISRLRNSAPKVMCATSMRTDIDNLAKFVLDSLNHVTYEDDKQIVSLHVVKLFDNDMANRYQGSTTLTIRLLRDDDMSANILEQQQKLFVNDKQVNSADL